MNEEVKVADTTQETAETQNSNETKTYTMAEVEEMIEEARKATEHKAKKKFEAKMSERLTEAEKLSKMDEEQKERYEFEKQKAELEENQRKFALLQNEVQATKIMEERGLPVAFASYIVAEDAETMMDNIKTFEKAFKSAVQDAVNAKISSPSAPKGTGVRQTGLTKEAFNKMNLAQKQELYTSNPELYKQMMG